MARGGAADVAVQSKPGAAERAVLVWPSWPRELPSVHDQRIHKTDRQEGTSIIWGKIENICPAKYLPSDEATVTDLFEESRLCRDLTTVSTSWGLEPLNILVIAV